jgi:hypothetical protein
MHVGSIDTQLITRIEGLMADPPEGSVVLEFTPAAARCALDRWRGTHNRREKPSAIKYYAKDMASGQWRVNGSTIVFTDQKLIGDGQNRLIACTKANTPFASHVIFGVDHDCFDTMDQGRVRTPRDVLEIEGVTDPTRVMQAVRWAELIESGEATSRKGIAGREIRNLLVKHVRVADFLPEARRISQLNRQPVGVVAALLYLFDKVDSGLAADFSEAWQSGSYGKRFSGIGTMQAEILRMSNSGRGVVYDLVRIAMIINAWNSARHGRRRIRWDRGDLFPMIQ